MLSAHAHHRTGMVATQARAAAIPRRTTRGSRPTPAHWLAPIRRATRREWLYLSAQIGLVAGIELSDDAVHAALPTVNAAAGVANAARVMGFERAHGFWLEPGIQRFFAGTHTILGQTIGWAQVRPIVDTLYGQGHVLFTLTFALWVFFWRRSLFPLIRNVFLLTNVLAVVLYETFPLAPPRLATNLSYRGRPFHFLDAVFGGGGGLKIGFNDYAAMPSVHVAWALIVGLTVAWAARSRVPRVLGLFYPMIMLTTVIVTGNHYLADGLGALAVVSVASLVAVLIAWRQAGGVALGRLLQQLRDAGDPVRNGANAATSELRTVIHRRADAA